MMVSVLFSFLVSILPIRRESTPHAIYLSVVQIDHRDLSADARVLVKVFSDDLQDVIRAAYPEKIERTEASVFCDHNPGLIEDYFQSRLELLIDGRQTLMEFISGTKENDVFWLTFKFQAPAQWGQVAVRAPFFMEIFSTQSNVIQLIHGTHKRFARITRKEQMVRFEF